MCVCVWACVSVCERERDEMGKNSNAFFRSFELLKKLKKIDLKNNEYFLPTYTQQESDTVFPRYSTFRNYKLKHYKDHYVADHTWRPV